MRIGVISDTHGQLPSVIFDLFHGVDHILHAGDIGTEEVLIELRAIAPLTVIRGNIDAYGPCARYPERTDVTLGGVRFHVVHQLAQVEPDLAGGTWNDHWDGPVPDVLVYGHSHQGMTHACGDTLLFNPGSAGPRRFSLVPSVGCMDIADGVPNARLMALDPAEQDTLIQTATAGV